MSEKERHKTSFLYKGGEIGCLLLHGFAGSPREVEPLGKALAKAGLTVLAPVLAGHCDLSTLETAGWKEWRQGAYASLVELSEYAKKVFIIGFSLGGLIAYDLAATEPVDGVVSINTPIRLVTRQELRGRLLKMARTGGYIGSDTDPTLDRVPMSCLSALYDYTVRVEDMLPQVIVPSLIIQSRDDEAINPGDSKLIRDALNSREKRLFWVDGATHLSVLDDKLGAIQKEVESFIRENAEKTNTGDEK